MLPSGRILSCSKCGRYYHEGCVREFIPVCVICKFESDKINTDKNSSKPKHEIIP